MVACEGSLKEPRNAQDGVCYKLLKHERIERLLPVRLCASLGRRRGVASHVESVEVSTATAAALQRRAQLKINQQQKINQKPTIVPLTPMTIVLEETVPPSEQGSYQSADDAELPQEQSEPPADE
eukprot:5644081-Amphidinium_carterae.4